MGDMYEKISSGLSSGMSLQQGSAEFLREFNLATTSGSKSQMTI